MTLNNSIFQKVIFENFAFKDGNCENIETDKIIYLDKNIKCNEIYFEFLECINIYKIYTSIVNRQYNTDILNYGGFLDFFKEISFSVKDDNLFEDILILFIN